MRTLLIFTYLLILTAACQNNDDDEFNREHIPGEYKGTLSYYDSPGWDVMGNSITELSKRDEYKTIIKKVGSNYVLSFDKSFVYSIPDITVEIFSVYDSELVGIRTLDGQAFSSVSKSNFKDQPPNYFWITRYPQVAVCELTLKSNDPDSAYFLSLTLRRIY